MLKEQKIVSKCCGAKIEYSEGGYIGEEICPVVISCSGCRKSSPYLATKWSKAGRPKKVETPF